MRALQLISDKFSIGLSMLCTIHCLLLPLMVAVLPSVMAFDLTGERFHIWMLVAVLPISIYALTIGCKEHQRLGVFILVGIGLLLLVSGLFAEAFYGEAGEKLLTVLGSMIVATGHLWNYQLSKQSEPTPACDCTGAEAK